MNAKEHARHLARIHAWPDNDPRDDWLSIPDEEKLVYIRKYLTEYGEQSHIFEENTAYIDQILDAAIRTRDPVAASIAWGAAQAAMLDYKGPYKLFEQERLEIVLEQSMTPNIDHELDMQRG